MSTISDRLRAPCQNEHTYDPDKDEAADTIDALVEALGEAAPYVPEHHGPTRHKIDAALAMARKER